MKGKQQSFPDSSSQKQQRNSQIQHICRIKGARFSSSLFSSSSVLLSPSLFQVILLLCCDGRGLLLMMVILFFSLIHGVTTGCAFFFLTIRGLCTRTVGEGIPSRTFRFYRLHSNHINARGFVIFGCISYAPLVKLAKLKYIGPFLGTYTLHKIVVCVVGS